MAQAVQAGVHHDAVQPAADRTVVPEPRRVSVGLEQRVLEGVGGILRIMAGQPGEPVQLLAVPVEQLLERVPVAGDVCRQQFRV